MKITDIDRNTAEFSLDKNLKTENQLLKQILKEKLNLTELDLKKLLEKKSEINIPLSVYHNDLSTLESSVLYLKTYKSLRNTEIASLLNRDQKTIWSAIERAEKRNLSIFVDPNAKTIPVKELANRKFSILESLVAFLKDHENFSLKQIADLLRLDPRTIWTVYARYTKKR